MKVYFNFTAGYVVKQILRSVINSIRNNSSCSGAKECWVGNFDIHDII